MTQIFATITIASYAYWTGATGQKGLKKFRWGQGVFQVRFKLMWKNQPSPQPSPKGRGSKQPIHSVSSYEWALNPSPSPFGRGLG